MKRAIAPATMIRGSAQGGTPVSLQAPRVRWRGGLGLGTSAALVATLAAGAAWGSTPSGPRTPAAAPAAQAHAAREPAAALPLAFAGLRWGVHADGIARALTAAGFAPLAPVAGEGAAWAGAAFGRRARLVTESGPDGELVAVTLRFDTRARGSALQRYAELVERVRLRHGAWAERVEPGRPVSESWQGRLGVLRRVGERSAATLWAGADGAAAVVQLDGDDVLWLRYESPNWDTARAGLGLDPAR